MSNLEILSNSALGNKMTRLIRISCLLFLSSIPCLAQNARPVTVSVLDLGNSQMAKHLGDQLRTKLRSQLHVPDADLVGAAARGIGYTGSLNLSLEEARDLGTALASDYYIVGDAQTLRRSSSQRPIYYESYCSIFLVSSRSGRLILWERPSFETEQATKAEAQLSELILGDEFLRRLQDAIRTTFKAEIEERLIIPAKPEAVIEAAPDDDKVAEHQGLRLPRPYRRFRPEYPDSAARADVEATVDVVVDIGADGEVNQVRVERWAGFGLDESTVNTVRKMHFFPAHKNGSPIAMRVLLRYNFRKSPR
jgi:TonB family protein